jgi:hypothetical protein
LVPRPSGSFLKITEEAQIFNMLISTEKSIINFEKSVWLHFGNIFKNTFGHPVFESRCLSKKQLKFSN